MDFGVGLSTGGGVRSWAACPLRDACPCHTAFGYEKTRAGIETDLLLGALD